MYEYTLIQSLIELCLSVHYLYFIILYNTWKLTWAPYNIQYRHKNMMIYVKISKYVRVNLCLFLIMFIQTLIILPTKVVKENEVHEAEFQENAKYSQISR